MEVDLYVPSTQGKQGRKKLSQFILRIKKKYTTGMSFLPMLSPAVRSWPSTSISDQRNDIKHKHRRNTNLKFNPL
jgi:hypothetical protein